MTLICLCAVMSTYICIETSFHEMEWLRLVGPLKIYVSFAEYSLFYRALFAKETYYFKEPTSRSQPITFIDVCSFFHVNIYLLIGIFSRHLIPIYRHFPAWTFICVMEFVSCQHISIYRHLFTSTYIYI